MQCKSLWIKASAKCINVNVNVLLFLIRCYSSPFEKYYGAHCELYSRGAGFYAVLFGCLAAFALLIIVLAVMIGILYRAKRSV